jgi:hypothetical protein
MQLSVRWRDTAAMTRRVDGRVYTNIYMKLRHVEYKAAKALRRLSPGSSLRISEPLPRF